jgi:MoaA/NifB/PqqE/SkfB family radical SAM enzyme
MLRAKLDYTRFMWRYARSRVAGTPVWAHLFITYRCNLDCPYCTLHFPFRRSRDMSLEMFESVIRGLEAVRCGLVGFMGGEPTLHKDLPAMIARTRSAGMITHLSTNGLRLQPEYLDELGRAGLHVVNLSIDSINAGQGSPKTLDAIRDAIDLLVDRRRRYGYAIYVNQVVLPENLNQVTLLAEYLTQRDVNMTVTFAVQDDAAKSGAGKLIGFDSPEMLAQLDAAVAEVIALKRRGYTLATSRAYLRTAQHFARHGRAPMYCNAGKESMQIDPDGTISMCSIAPTPRHRLKLHASELTPERWRALRPQVEAALRQCNPTCLAGCQFESAYSYRHPWEVLPSYILGSLRHLQR